MPCFKIRKHIISKGVQTFCQCIRRSHLFTRKIINLTVIRMHRRNRLLRSEFIHKVCKHVKTYIIIISALYNICKRIGRIQTVFHPLSKLCIALCLCTSEILKQPSKVFFRTVSRLKIITENIVGGLYERIFLCSDRPFISVTKFVQGEPVPYQICIQAFSIIGTVILAVICLTCAMRIGFDKKFCPHILIPWFLCIKIQTRIGIVLFYKCRIPFQHFIQCFKTINIFFISIRRVDDIVFVTDRDKKSSRTALYDCKRRLTFIPGIKKCLLGISIAIIWDFFQGIGIFIFNHRLYGCTFRCCDKWYTVGLFCVR